MNDLEWRRDLRALREPVTPARDLWPAIERAITTGTETMRPPSRRPAWRAVAMLAAVAVLAAGATATWRLPPPAGSMAAAPAAPTLDPRLRAAFIELDATRAMLNQTLQEDPGSPLLRRLLARTAHQQMRLHHLAHEAG